MSGWEPVVATRYEYDDQGRLVGSETIREPEWSRADVESLIAYTESQRVGSHGHPMSDAMSPDGDPSNPARKWDWHVPLPVIDFAQKALSERKKAFEETYKDFDLSGYVWRVEKRDL